MSNRFFPHYKGFIVTSRFGRRVHPVTGVVKDHRGIDLVATKDGKTGQVDDIMAHTAGVVTAVGFDSISGNLVKIRVADGAIMVYYHLKDKPSLKVGQAVKQGQIIGHMGDTGRVTGAHLHFGIQKGGKWIDPEPYLDKDWLKTQDVPMPVLKRGDKGEPVKALQVLLHLRAGSGLEIDGSFGPATEGAVKAYAGQNCCDSSLWQRLIFGV